MSAFTYGVDDIESERTLGLDPLAVHKVLVLHKYVMVRPRYLEILLMDAFETYSLGKSSSGSLRKH